MDRTPLAMRASGSMSPVDHENRVQYLADAWTEKGAAFLASSESRADKEQKRIETDAIVWEVRGDEERGALPLHVSHSEDVKARGIGSTLSLSVYRTKILMQRSVLNYRRNLLAYGVRVGMYGMFDHSHVCAGARGLTMIHFTLNSWHRVTAGHDMDPAWNERCQN